MIHMYPIASGLPTSGKRPRTLETKVKSMIRSIRDTALTSHAIELVVLEAELELDAPEVPGDG